ncbi:hypothetical protein DFH09DRAFT_1250319 [Mycena vulgaris]|nr:hypothetical protein DFH09DRAFT_1250319 [Mycena vulgaris]
MYCLNGTQGYDDSDSNEAVQPLWQLSKEDWWFHHMNQVSFFPRKTSTSHANIPQCDEFPPNDGDFLELRLAVNRVFTTLSYGGSRVGDFGDGQNYTEGLGGTECITELNIHTQNESMAAGTAFAISYQSELSAVTPENLVVFTTLDHTPWKRIATYSVPNLPACPTDGCICAWGWVANGCGEPNIYMQGFRCKVTGTTGDSALAPAAAAVWCVDGAATCVTGARQMIFWNQLEGNNIDVPGNDTAGGTGISPAYNMKLGWGDGALLPVT